LRNCGRNHKPLRRGVRKPTICMFKTNRRNSEQKGKGPSFKQSKGNSKKRVNLRTQVSWEIAEDTLKALELDENQYAMGALQ
jgi:hypothetical protein